MICPRCSADNSAGMKFCGQCGAPLGGACPSCGSGNPPGSQILRAVAALRSAGSRRPSPACGGGKGGGGRQLRGHAPGEMKQVTVLFCDIVGSTPLTERLGSRKRCGTSSFSRRALPRYRYGGTAPQFTGDGFMAVFRAPVTQEDHVQRALSGRLGFQRALTGSAAARRR